MIHSLTRRASDSDNRMGLGVGADVVVVVLGSASFAAPRTVWDRTRRNDRQQTSWIVSNQHTRCCSGDDDGAEDDKGAEEEEEALLLLMTLFSDRGTFAMYRTQGPTGLRVASVVSLSVAVLFVSVEELPVAVPL